jgi:dihydroorotase-like cyclic amidohydrolase
MHHEIRDNVAAAVSVAESHLLSERFNKRISLQRLQKIMCTRPAEIYGMKGCPNNQILRLGN